MKSIRDIKYYQRKEKIIDLLIKFYPKAFTVAMLRKLINMGDNTIRGIILKLEKEKLIEVIHIGYRNFVVRWKEK